MNPLLTNAEFIARFSGVEVLQICGLGSGQSRVVDDARLEYELEAASSLVFSYLNARFPLALQFPNSLLKGFVADITRWYLRGKGGQQSNMEDVVYQRYQEAIRHLKLMMNGELSIAPDAIAYAAYVALTPDLSDDVMPQAPLSGAALDYRVSATQPTTNLSAFKGFFA